MNTTLIIIGIILILAIIIGVYMYFRMSKRVGVSYGGYDDKPIYEMTDLEKIERLKQHNEENYRKLLDARQEYVGRQYQLYMDVYSSLFNSEDSKSYFDNKNEFENNFRLLKWAKLDFDSLSEGYDESRQLWDDVVDQYFKAKMAGIEPIISKSTMSKITDYIDPHLSAKRLKKGSEDTSTLNLSYPDPGQYPVGYS